MPASLEFGPSSSFCSSAHTAAALSLPLSRHKPGFVLPAVCVVDDRQFAPSHQSVILSSSGQTGDLQRQRPGAGKESTVMLETAGHTTRPHHSQCILQPSKLWRESRTLSELEMLLYRSHGSRRRM